MLPSSGAANAVPEPDFGTWDARIALSFARREHGTQLARTEHVGPLRVQRPFHPEGEQGPCHVYLLHPPGGVVSGDRLRIELDLQAHTQATLTAPGANKFYTARGERHAALSQVVRVAEGATAEWMPPETIAFDGTRGILQSEIHLDEGATYAGWEILCFGRPAAEESFARGWLRSELTILRAGRLQYVERGLYRGGDPVMNAPWGLHGQPVLATYVVASPQATQEWVEHVRACVEPESGAFAVTLVSGVLVVRFLGSSTREARVCLERAFGVLRPLYAGRQAVHPRIWST